MAIREHIEAFRSGVVKWNGWRESNPEIRPDLTKTDLEADGCVRDWNRSVLEHPDVRPDFNDVLLSEARLPRVVLRADLWRADLWRAELWEADLRGADLRGSILWDAKLGGADLSQSDLTRADLWDADLRQADLRGADLRGAQLVSSKLQGAKLQRARIYGVSVWDIEVDDATQQTDLVISPPDEPDVSVDNLEVAQFVHLLINNKRIRDVIDTVTSKAVLILGRFTETRKVVLERLRDELRIRGLVPIIFDWPASSKRDLTETVQLLANMARFVVADVTDAKSIPQELSSIIPFLPSVPVRPLIVASQQEYALFEHWRRFSSVLPEFVYRNDEHLMAHFDDAIMSPIEKWEAETDKSKAREDGLRQRIRELEAQLAARHKADG